ncbi:MAG: serine hydrolase domain-containing protein, partial [Pirellula sp.]
MRQENEVAAIHCANANNNMRFINSRFFMTLLGDCQYKQARSQAPAAPAWKRTVSEALPPVSINSTSLRQAEPAIHLVPRQSLGTRCWRSARSVFFISVCGLMLILLASKSTFAQNFATAFQIVEQAVADGSIPGASVLIMRHGKVIEQRAFGVCEIDPIRPFQTDTICWIASITKPITATAAMKLVEGGKLNLDKP